VEANNNQDSSSEEDQGKQTSDFLYISAIMAVSFVLVAMAVIGPPTFAILKAG